MTRKDATSATMARLAAIDIGSNAIRLRVVDVDAPLMTEEGPRFYPFRDVLADRAAVQDHVMADRAVPADRQREAAVGVAGRIVLHVGAFADLDPFIVAAQHRAEPDARRTQEANLADDDGGVGNEVVSVRGQIGALSVQFVDRHACLLSASDIGTATNAFSSQHACRAQRHQEEGTRDQAPEARDDGCHHHEFEAPALDPRAAQRIAHDDERCGEHQERNNRERARRHPFVQQAKPRRPPHQRLVAARQRTSQRETDANGEHGTQRIGGHSTNLTGDRTCLP